MHLQQSEQHPKTHNHQTQGQTIQAISSRKKPSKCVSFPRKIRKGKPTFQLVDEEDEARQDDDPDLDLAKKLSLEAHQEKGEEEGNDADLERAIKLSLDPSFFFLPQVRANTYPKVHEKLKLITDERVIDDKLESHSGSMSSMKNLDDTFNFGDQFLHDKPTEDDQEKSKVRDESDSTIPDSSHQTVTSTPPVIAPLFLIHENHMNKKKSANKNTTNYRLYHALMEALIADEDAMDKEVADKGRSTKRRRSDSAASGSAKPPPKADDQSSKKPRESEASASKQHPTLSSTGWQITDTREAGVDSSMHRSDPESEHSEQSSDDISKQDEGNDSDMEDTDNAHIPKVSTTTWFKADSRNERPAILKPEMDHSPK
ncbi:hypothetical protein Tco_1028545 [Tanacetum coccineum]|uniref:Uncharacterized protein n=1 Tax=Tanacetum coccineum TaxID=301880 RepID=A0ABQ5G2F9_9ASTR